MAGKRKSFIPMMQVGIKTGTILYDSIPDSLGYVYNPTSYDEEGNRRDRYMEMPRRSTFFVPNYDVDFDAEVYCESCHQNGRGDENELRIKGNKLYCPVCGVTKPHAWMG